MPTATETMQFKDINNRIFNILKNVFLPCAIIVISFSAQAAIKIGISTDIKCKLENKKYHNLQFYRKQDAELVQDFVSINSDVSILNSSFFEIIHDGYKYAHFKIYAHVINEGGLYSTNYIVLVQENAFNYSKAEKNEFINYLSKQNCFNRNSSLEFFPNLNPNMVFN